MVRGHGVDDGIALAVLTEKLDPDLEMRPLQLAVHRFPDVVHEGGSDRDVRVQPDLAGHYASQIRDLLGMGQHVLAVAGPVLEPSHHPVDLRMQVVKLQLVRGGLTFLECRLIDLRFDFADHLFDAGWVDAAVGDELLDRLFGDLASIRIEARQDDCAGCVVDDELDARRDLERPNVASLSTNDATLEVVTGQVDDRDRCLDRVLGRAPLDRLGDDLLRLLGGGFPRLVLEPFHEVRGVAACIRLELTQQDLLGLVRRHTRYALQLALLLGHERRVPLSLRLQVGLALIDGVFASLKVLLGLVRRRLALRETASLIGQLLFEGGDFLLTCARLVLGRAQQLVRLLFGGQDDFLAPRLRIAFGLMQEAFGVRLSSPNGLRRHPLSGGQPPDEEDGPRRNRDEKGCAV